MYRNSLVHRSSSLKKNKHKLFILIIKRAVNRLLRDSLTTMKEQTDITTKALKSICKNSERNMDVSKLLAWHKIKAFSLQVKSEQRIFKDVFILSNRLQKFAIRKAFNKIQTFFYRSDASLLKKILASRGALMFRNLKKLQTNKKKQTMTTIRTYCNYQKFKKRLLILGVIRKNLQKKLILWSWSKLVRRMSCTVEPEDDKVQDLETQIQDMKVQISNKNQNISRLNIQLSELKQSISIRFDTSMMGLHNQTKSYSSLSKSRIKNSFDRQSNDDGKQESYGSLFSGSFFSNRSRNKSIKEKNTEACSCGSYQRYQKYKSANETLKKQIQIIKTQLEFTKDMNEHMENEMKQFFGSGDENSKKIEKVKGQLRQVQKERDVLKEKVLKYDKYVNKLKMEFKLKIEEIYRKVRRNGGV